MNWRFYSPFLFHAVIAPHMEEVTAWSTPLEFN